MDNHRLNSNSVRSRIDTSTPKSFYCSPKSYHYIPFAQRRSRPVDLRRRTNDANSKWNKFSDQSHQCLSAKQQRISKLSTMNHKLDSMQNHCASPSEAAHCSNNQLQIPKQERGNRVLNLSEPKIPPQTFLSVYASDDEQMLEKLDQFKNEILNDIIRRGVYTDSVIQDCISKHVLENSTLTMVNLQQAINELLIDIGFSNDQINKTMLITNSETTATREELFSYEDKEFGSDEGECLSVIPSESDSEELEKEDDSITSNFESESSTDSLATLNNSSVADTINLSAPRSETNKL